MKREDVHSGRPGKRKIRKGFLIAAVLLCILLVGAIFGGIFWYVGSKDDETKSGEAGKESVPRGEAPREEAQSRETGYLASVESTVEYYDEKGTPSGTLPRGTQVQYARLPDGRTEILLEGKVYTLQEGDAVVQDAADLVPAHTLYVRTAVNLRDAEGKLLDAFADKGSVLEVTGCDTVNSDGSVHAYRVLFGEREGYIPPHYLVKTLDEALANYGDSYALHAARGDRYGGGDAAGLDYFPREKAPIEGNAMPAECRTLYMATWSVKNVDQYLALASGTGINAFVVDIADSGAIGYASDVMKHYAPTAARAAHNTVEEYKSAIEKIRSAGYYVIGRITTFNDTYFVKDHPEFAICGTDGSPIKLSGEYWPTAFNRTVWQYKVDLAVEAVKLMGFHEIQFDYVRFPDRTGSLEKAGKLNFGNLYGESKAQAIQRFLMYATDIIRENGAYVSADVFGESAYTYVTAYGQYWPAISTVVDVVSGMPYPDHFAASGDWRPWEHPYETLKKWGENVMVRQSETANPAAVRTWIQAYNAIREPYNVYGPDELSAQIRALRDAGCTGGFITWNAAASIEKYKRLAPSFSAS